MHTKLWANIAAAIVIGLITAYGLNYVRAARPL